jgi:hypothetical protein
LVTNREHAIRKRGSGGEKGRGRKAKKGTVDLRR